MLATDVMGCRLQTESGELRGHVFDIRLRRDGERWRVVGLVIGRRGLLERLGFTDAKRIEPVAHHDLYDWDAVVAVADGVVVVRESARPV
jgi:hypothetical protein